MMHSTAYKPVLHVGRASAQWQQAPHAARTAQVSVAPRSNDVTDI
jgi:hypothetical protein